MKRPQGNEGEDRMARQSFGRVRDFVVEQVLGKGLDERTARAYRTDLEHLYLWLGKYGKGQLERGAVEDYLNYLVNEEGLKYSTVTRKYRVFCYYMEYLERKDIMRGCLPIAFPDFVGADGRKADNALSRAEADAFFAAMDREYVRLDSEFRRRICLRDSVMMGLLFYHGIEVSELVRLEVGDYSSRTGSLAIRGKKGKGRVEHLFSGRLRGKMEQWIRERVYFAAEDEGHAVLFPSKAGKPLSMKAVVLAFEKYRRLAGIKEGVTPKDLKCSMGKYAKELMMERCG